MSVYTQAAEKLRTIADFLRLGLSQAHKVGLYYGHGTDNAWDDILSLVLRSLNLPLDLNPDLLQANLLDDERHLLAERLQQRIEQRIPVPYLIHEALFCGLSFFVDERVLIPRSPLAEMIEDRFSPWIDDDTVTQILDIGTGSGCIAIASCYAFPEAKVDALDISPDALAVARMNCQRHEVSSQLDLFQSDGFSDCPKKRYHIIVSNPPYVGDAEMETLPTEYTHEPVLALQAENNGLAIVERILREASDYLHEDGILVMEVGNSADAILDAYPHVPFIWPDFERGGDGIFILNYHELYKHFAQK